MDQDTVISDTIAGRPLPAWLIKQKEGLNTYQPEPYVMREDRSLEVSLIATGAGILLIVILLTIYFLKKK